MYMRAALRARIVRPERHGSESRRRAERGRIGARARVLLTGGHLRACRGQCATLFYIWYLENSASVVYSTGVSSRVDRH